jgi:hypothetical protein
MPATDRVVVLDPGPTARLSVDMQSDVVRKGAPLAVPEARATLPRQRQLLGHSRRRGPPGTFARFMAGPGPTLIWNRSPILAPRTCCSWPGVSRFCHHVQVELDCTDVLQELYQLADADGGVHRRDDGRSGGDPGVGEWRLRMGTELGWRSLGYSCVARLRGAFLARRGDQAGVETARVVLGSPDLAKWRGLATYLADRRPDVHHPYLG